MGMGQQNPAAGQANEVDDMQARLNALQGLWSVQTFLQLYTILFKIKLVKQFRICLQMLHFNEWFWLMICKEYW